MCSIDLTTPNCDLHLLNFPSQSRQTTLLTKKEKIPFSLNRELAVLNVLTQVK